VAAPGVRDALIHDALILAGEPIIPSRRHEFHLFANGALRQVAQRALGPELADTIADEVLRVTQAVPSTFPPPAVPGQQTESAPPRSNPSARRRASSAGPASRKTVTLGTPVGRTTPHAGSPRLTPVPLGTRRRPTPRPQHAVKPMSQNPDSHTRRQSDPKMPAGTRVFIATTEESFMETFVVWLGDRAAVLRVKSIMELVRQVDGVRGGRVMVIIDGKNPSIRPAALAVLLEDMHDIEVVVCRAPSETIDVVLAASPSTARWVVYREPASLDRVAAECVKRVS
jgi:hypothetical protein